MENTKYDDKFYRLPKRLFKEDQFRSMTNEAKTLYMILLDRRCLSECNGDAWRDEYGPAIKRKWILRDWIKNIQADCFWRSLACKRYQRYFYWMKAIVKNNAT